MSRHAMERAAAHTLHHQLGGGGDPVILEAFRRNYRFWASLPPAVDSVLFLARPGAVAPDDTMLAVVARPDFPAGVCTGCGCSHFDACPGDFGEGCGWVDATRTRCTSCGARARGGEEAKGGEDAMSATAPMDGAARILAERARQVAAKGWTLAHDDTHDRGELVLAAMAYARVADRQIVASLTEAPPRPSQLKRRPATWPFEPEAWHPSDDPVRNLEKAGALIAAEIDRLQRAANGEGGA